MSNGYTVTIGLEVHAELATESKMFCGCKNDPHGGEPNAYTCPVCLAHPGTLPVPNKEAVAKVLLFGRAIGATQADFSEFDRKNYFYPDIPKAYQISQYAFPLLTGGEIKGIQITRVHLEEDTARSQHDQGEGSLIDFNRAGVPLMELVTEPVIHDAKLAGEFARELQLLLKTLQISNAQMERGEMRVEANISVSKTSELGTKVEVKNLNSFRSVEAAIDYEVARQIELLERGEVVRQETMGWDEAKQKTYTQRSKETAKDYRYFPDPDIPKLKLSEISSFSVSRLNDMLPLLPDNKRVLYSDLGLTSNQIEIIISTASLDKIFTEAYALEHTTDPKCLNLLANYLTSDILALSASGRLVKQKTSSLCTLMKLLQTSQINSRIAKDLLTECIDSDVDLETLARERGLLQSSDPSTLTTLIADIVNENKTMVEEYRAGKEAVLQFLVGQGMKKSKGAANPVMLAELIKAKITE
jgi:aspartyl-tRNA(Asn)/glutamyl-tRNA(Gln) amidotransferase subunit B